MWEGLRKSSCQQSAGIIVFMADVGHNDILNKGHSRMSQKYRKNLAIQDKHNWEMIFILSHVREMGTPENPPHKPESGNNKNRLTYWLLAKI